MIGRRYGSLTLLAFLALLSVVLAASPASFCKCTCFSNSTIIQLNGLSDTSSSRSSIKEITDSLFEHRRRATKERTCNDCNRQFCLEKNNLPICKGAKEEDVMTTCFQRDSSKDQAVVLIFVIATGSLLLYAAIRPYIERFRERTKERGTYIPVSSQTQ